MTQLDEPAPPPGEPTDQPWEPTEDPGLVTYATPPGRNGTVRDLHAPNRDDRTPPQAPAAEQAVLGAMIQTPQAIDDVEPELDPTDFYNPAHEQIYEAILVMHSIGTPIDMITLAGHLAKIPATRRGRTASLLDTIGGHTYLHDLSSACPIPANATHYAKEVRDAARLRQVVTTGTRLLQLGYSADLDRIDSYLGEALQTLDDTVQRFGPRTHGPGIGTGLTDLSWILEGGQAPKQPEPIYVRRHDGTALFYDGQVNGVFGDPEHGKTWLAQLAIVQALNAGGTASMIDCDHNGPNSSAARLLLLGARPEHLADPARFRYYEPQEGEQLLNAVTEVTTRADNVLLLDSIGEALALLGANENHGDEVTKAMRQTCTRPAMAGTCVIVVDHLPKSSEARATGFAIGTIAKKRMIRGAYLRADAKVKPTPGGIGRITLRIEKDTMGELRRSSGGGYAGELILDSTHDYALEWTIRREVMPVSQDGTARPTTLMERVSTYVGDHDGCTGRDIQEAVQGKDRWVREAIQILVTEGHISRQPGKQRRMHHHLEIPYREAEDDLAQ